MIEQMSREEKIKFCGLNLEAEEDFDNTIEILIGNSGKEYIIAQEVIADFIRIAIELIKVDCMQYSFNVSFINEELNTISNKASKLKLFGDNIYTIEGISKSNNQVYLMITYNKETNTVEIYIENLLVTKETSLIDCLEAQGTNLNYETVDFRGIILNTTDLPREIQVTKLIETFKGFCIDTIDITGLDTRYIKDTTKCFANCTSLNRIIGIESIDTSSLKIADNMFEVSLDIDLNLSSWDTSKIISIDEMFSGSINSTINVSNWNLPNLESANKLFHNCCNCNIEGLTTWKLPELDEKAGTFYQIGNIYSNGDCIKDLNLAAINMKSIYKLGLPDFDEIYKKNIDETVDKVISNSISLGRIHISNNYTKVIAFSKELEKYDVFNRALINRLDAVRTNSAISGLIINDYMAEKVKERKIPGAEKIKIIYI